MNCIILVANEKYLEKAKHTINQLRIIGKYEGDIVLIVGDDLKDLELDRVIVKHFSDIDRSEIIDILKKKPIGDGREVNKIFQWHKIHIFDTYFKMWKKCLYIDAGMFIFKPINKIMSLDCTNKLLAHSDAYPTYQWKLNCQFDNKQFSSLYEELNNLYNLDVDYFQTTLLLYDTNIIENYTKQTLINFSRLYINSRTNEQGIMNLYFKNKWEQIRIKDDDTFYYDFFERGNYTYMDYIMLKYPKTL